MSNVETEKLFSEIQAIATSIQSGDIILRQEGDRAILYGKIEGRCRTFQLDLNPLATFLMMMVRDGYNGAAIFQALLEAGQKKSEALRNLENLIAITAFDQSNIEAVRLNPIDRDLSAPLNITWDITNVCNLRCSHCYNSSGNVLDTSMPLEKCLAVVDELAELGVMNVWIGGGEPLMKPGIDRILQRMKLHNMRVVLATNGVLLKKDRMLEVVGETCTEVNISIDGSAAESHSFLRGKSARLQDSLRAITLLKDTFGKRLYVTALTVVHRKNLEEVPAIIDLAYDVGCNKWTHDELYAMGRGAVLNHLVMSHEGFDRLYDVVQEKMLEYRGKMHVENYVRMHKYAVPGETKSFYGCAAGSQEIAIQDSGDVYPCQKLQYSKYWCGNLSNTSLHEIWEKSPILKWLRNRDVTETECSGCNAFSAGTCNGGCLAEKEIVFGRHDTRDPLCPENRGIYRDILDDKPVVYEHILHPVKEIVPSSE